MNREPRYEVLPHTADLGVRVRGRDAAEVFANAAYALSDNLIDLRAVEPATERVIEVSASDIEDLLVRWLGELLFVFEQEAFIGCEFDVSLDAAEPTCGLRAVARGERVDPARHTVYSEIKAVTYHGLVVTEDAEGWRAEVIFDL
jgi:SHS2 domain-containing protein